MTAHLPTNFFPEMPGDNVLHQLSAMQPVDAILPEWKRKRLGKITASEFVKVKKLKNGQWGETALTYIYDLIGEHLSGEESESFTGSKATDWGELYEDDAAKEYTKRTGKKVQKAEFLQHDKLPWVGATPDRKVGEVGLLEIKCPFNYKNHIRTVRSRKVPADYLPQVLGQLWLSGREWVDFVSYDPRIKGVHRLCIVRVRRAEYLEELKELEGLITEAHELLLSELKALKVKPGQNFNF